MENPNEEVKIAPIRAITFEGREEDIRWIEEWQKKYGENKALATFTLRKIIEPLDGILTNVIQQLTGLNATIEGLHQMLIDLNERMKILEGTSPAERNAPKTQGYAQRMKEVEDGTKQPEQNAGN